MKRFATHANMWQHTSFGCDAGFVFPAKREWHHNFVSDYLQDACVPSFDTLSFNITMVRTQCSKEALH